MAPHYLCVPADLADDPRTIHLGALVGSLWPDGLLLRLWSWACRQSPDGMIGSYPDSVIERSASWIGTPGALVDALRQSGWLLDCGTLADWSMLYRVEARRIAERQKKQRQRQAAGAKDVSPGHSRGNPLISQISNSDLSERESAERERPAPPQPPPRQPQRDRSRLGPLDAHWWESDPSVLRAHLLAMGGPGELLALPDPDGPGNVLESIQARFPAWDGLDGRPTVQERAESTWDALRARLERRSSDPMRAIGAWRQWIGDRHDQAAQRLRRASGGTDDPSALASPLARLLRPLES